MTLPPDDTSAEAYRVQVGVWRRMGGAATAVLAIRMSEDAREVTAAGIRARHPEYDDQAVRYALYRLIHGDALFAAAWPNAPRLAP